MAKFWIRVEKLFAGRPIPRRYTRVWLRRCSTGGRRYGDKVWAACRRKVRASEAEFRAFHYRAIAEAVEKSLIARLLPTHELWCVWPDTGAERTGIRGIPGVTAYKRARFAHYEWRPISTEAA